MARLRFDKGKYIYIEYYDPLLGRSTSKPLKILNKKDNFSLARRKLKEFEAGLLNLDNVEEYKPESSLLLSDMFDRYKAIKEGVIELKPMEYAFKKLIDFTGDRQLKLLTIEQKKFLLFLEKNKLSYNTQAIIVSQLHSMFNTFITMNFAEKNPFTVIKRKKKNIVVISTEDMKKILNHFKQNKNQYCFLMYLVYTGQRKSDALQLRWENIDFTQGTMELTNQKKKRTYSFPLTKQLKELFEYIGIESEGNVFPYKHTSIKFFYKAQKGSTRRLADGSIKRYEPKLKLSKYYSLHNFRKTFGTFIAEMTNSTAEAMKLLDHTSEITTREHYQYINLKKLGEEMSEKFRDSTPEYTPTEICDEDYII